jgi:hypothetical protein
LESNFAGTLKGQRVMNIIIKDDNFLRQVKYYLTAMTPLVKVLKFIDGDTKLIIGYIYIAMDQTKEEITRSFDNEFHRYEKIWIIVDLR